MPTRPLRVGLVGYGLAGRFFHRPLIGATEGLALCSVVTADPARRAQAAADVPDAALLTHPEELWERAADHDLAVVAGPTGAHAELAVAAVEAGLPVVVEKPLAPSAADARRVLDAGRRAGVPVVPFHNRRWDADQLTLRRLLGEGALGEVLRYESRFERWRPVPTPGAWRESLPATAGGGVLLDLGVHLVDQALSLFGPVTRVYAEVAARRGGADDDVFLALEHAGGTRSHLWAGALAAAPGPRLRVLGTVAAFVVDGVDGQEDALRAGTPADAAGFGLEEPDRWGRLATGPDAPPLPVRSERGSWRSFYEGVVRMLRDGSAPPVDAADALTVLHVLDLARDAATARQVRPV